MTFRPSLLPLHYLALGLCVIIVGYPIYWLLVSSFKPISALFAGNASATFDSFSLLNYHAVFTNRRFWRFFLNSSIISVSATVITISLALFGGYSLARLRFPLVGLLGQMVFFVYMVPKVLLAIPLYLDV